MTRTPTSKNRILVALGFLLPLLILVAVAALALMTSRTLRSSHSWVDHTLEVRMTLYELLVRYGQAESGQRGYMLTGRDRYLDAYTRSVAGIQPLIDRLHVLIADNAHQEELLASLNGLNADKLDFAAHAVALKKAGRESEMMSLMATEHGADVMDKINAVVATMNQEENRLLVQRRELVNREVNLNEVLLVAFLLLDLIVVVGVALLLRRLRLLQQLVKICAWSRTIEYQGEWLSFEEYLQRRYGLKVTHGISETELARMKVEAEAPPSMLVSQETADGNAK